MSGMPVLGRSGRLAFLLVGVDFLDELASGIPFVAAPEIKSDFDVSYGRAAGWLLTAMGALGVILEPPLFVLADRHPRRWFVCGGLAVLGVSCLLAAVAPVYGTLVVALLVFGPASGCGVTLSQATLMDAHPDAREKWMVRWTLAGSLGDLATPAFVAGMAWIGAGWRGAFAALGFLLFGYAALLWRRPFPEPLASRDPAEARPRALLDPLRRGLARRSLRVWAVATILCSLLDEILVAFGSLYLRDVVGFGIEARATVVTALMVGAVLGLLVLERLLARFDARAVLAASGVLSALALSGWLFAETLWASAAGFFATGFFAAAHYPVAQAQAYRALPEGSGSVDALLTAGGALMLPVPILLGVVADTVGLREALALLLLQPVAVLWAALLARRRAG